MMDYRAAAWKKVFEARVRDMKACRQGEVLGRIQTDEQAAQFEFL